jgi:uncharacterized SAM-binding protein YcdF (DUF218 family)
MLDFLKSTLNLTTFFSLWAIFCFMGYVFKKRRLFIWSAVIGMLFFLVCTTSYIPKRLTMNLEDQYEVIELEKLDTSKPYYIHVLGAGYDLDKRLQATSQLDLNTLGRLTEGIRVFRKLPNAVLVTSGNSAVGLESQASVARRAAMELGVPAYNIQMLETPTTTWEEVQAFKDKFGQNKIVIVATDAAHMPRAMKMYRAAGYEPVAAPTNFKVKFDTNNYHGISWPNVGSFQLMNEWLRAEMAMVKWKIQGKSIEY